MGLSKWHNPATHRHLERVFNNRELRANRLNKQWDALDIKQGRLLEDKFNAKTPGERKLIQSKIDKLWKLKDSIVDKHDSHRRAAGRYADMWRRIDDLRIK